MKGLDSFNPFNVIDLLRSYDDEEGAMKEVAVVSPYPNPHGNAGTDPTTSQLPPPYPGVPQTFHHSSINIYTLFNKNSICKFLKP